MIREIKDSVQLSSVLTYRLVAQTPLIHFQQAQSGATLRATEVKPKLDKFLIRKAAECGMDLGRWFLKTTTALDYKLRFVEKKRHEVCELGIRTDYDLYYGNQGVEDPDKKKKGVRSDVEMKFICAHRELLSFIDQYIAEFFVVTNFGSMSGKGFGSFVVQNREMSEGDIAKALKASTGASCCYAFDGGYTPFKRIKTIYGIMKSGMSVPCKVSSKLFDFLEEKGIGNEKEGLRARGLVPLKPTRTIPGQRFYYVRALLGVSDRTEYRLKGKGNTTINIKNPEIERLASPIFFKVIGNNVYMVANRINEEIYGKDFSFTNAATRKTHTFSVPEKADVSATFIDEFLAFAVREINMNHSGAKVLNGIRIREVK